MRALAPKGGNDKVYTPNYLAKEIVDHFKPCGKILEPCKGTGSFTSLFDEYDYCELDEGIDFLKVDLPNHYDWIVTNPPWSQFRAFLKKSMEVSENIVFLSLVNAFFMKARIEDMKKSGFGIVEILMLDTPSKPWPQTGFQLGATHIKKAYKGDIKINL